MSRRVGHLFARLAQAVLQRPPTPEGGRPRAGADPRAILCHTSHAHHTVVDQDRDGPRQQLIERRAVRHPKVAQRVMVDRLSGAQPAVGVVHLAQFGEAPRAANAADRRVQPQRDQHARVDRRASGTAFASPHFVAEPLQRQLLDGPPHQARPMPVRQQRLKVAHPEAQLPSVDRFVARGRVRDRPRLRRRRFQIGEERIAHSTLKVVRFGSPRKGLMPPRIEFFTDSEN